MSSAADTKTLIEQAIAHFLEEVPALAPLKLVAEIDLRGRGDVQQYRIEMPGPVVTKGYAADARVTLEVTRARFNELAATGRVKDWRSAFEHGDARVTGVDQVIRLIRQVVEKQEERTRLRRAKTHQ